MPGSIREAPLSPGFSSNYAARSIFPQAPTFSLDVFSDRDFSVKEFIESLSDSTVPLNRRGAGSTEQQAQVFDPRPLIRSFEHALGRMSELSGELEARETELSTVVRRAEAQHSTNVQNLSRKLDETIAAFETLDDTLHGRENGEYAAGTNSVVKIGEQIEDLDKQRERAMDAKFLIQCWLELSERGELFLLEDLRRQGSADRKIRCAQLARQLLKISQRLDPAAWRQVNGRGSLASGVNGTNGVNGHDDRSPIRHNTREIIEKFYETLEKDLLSQFDEFYRKANLDGMRDCARVLRDFNGGSSVIGMFVNQHQFFIDRSQLVAEEVAGDTETWNRLADPDADVPPVEPSLQSLVDEVKIVAQDESDIIKRAFEYSEQVLGLFLQRVFQQSLQQRLERVLEKAETISALAFLRSLQSSRTCVSSLVEDLKSHGLIDHPEPASAQTALILDQQFDDLFVPYFIDTPYIEREKKSLEELYSSLLFKFTLFHSRRRKVPTTFMASLAKQGSEMLSSAREAYIERLDSSDLAATQKRVLLRVAGLKDSDSARKQAEIEFSEKDGLLSVPTAKRMLKWLAEAVGRGLELSGGNETPKDVSALLNLLLLHMGSLYVETSLDGANEAAASQENSKSEPDLSYLENLDSAIAIMHLMSTCIKTVLLPLAAANITIRREMEKNTNLTMSRLEDKVNSIMQKTIDVVIAWVIKLLASQKKTDFRPRDDGLIGSGSWLEQLQTPTCLSIYQFLSRVHKLLSTALGPTSPNLSTLLLELAVPFRQLLLEHFRKFQVSPSGGIMVTKDMTKYIELMRKWNLEKGFEPSLEVLTEIGNVFVIGPEALRERVRGRQAGGTGPGARAGVGSGGAGVVGTDLGGNAGGQLWSMSDLRGYIARRDDVGSIGIQSVLSSL
ncbi:Exocyst complex component 5 [Agyrium rufum]|nr:Exocyst complex component 5 [Agyrium rufum]